MIYVFLYQNLNQEQVKETENSDMYLCISILEFKYDKIVVFYDDDLIYVFLYQNLNL